MQRIRQRKEEYTDHGGTIGIVRNRVSAASSIRRENAARSRGWPESRPLPPGAPTSCDGDLTSGRGGADGRLFPVVAWLIEARHRVIPESRTSPSAADGEPG